MVLPGGIEGTTGTSPGGFWDFIIFKERGWIKVPLLLNQGESPGSSKNVPSDLFLDILAYFHYLNLEQSTLVKIIKT